MQRLGDGLGRHRARSEWTERLLRREQTGTDGLGLTNRTREVPSALGLLQQVRTLRNLEAAWKVIRENGRFSKSEAVRADIAGFDENAWGNLQSLQQRLVKGSFKFPAARGVPIPKPGKKDIRPIVLAPVESRIIQRAVLDVLQGLEALQPFFRNPHSFGGIKRRTDDPLAAVPAAINAVLQSIDAGSRFVACGDISGFFTRISKIAVRKIIEGAVTDVGFMELFDRAVRVELSNLVQLRELAERFPTEDIGVAQGSSLSPLLGNILLHDFDRRMNDGDCGCIRYIDDFIILAPTEAAAMARLRRAKRLLNDLGMPLAEDKTSSQAIPITEVFEFLGIEFNNGLIRPSTKARIKFLESVRDVFRDSRRAFESYRNGKPLLKSQALLATLKRADGIIQGWGKHYRFCNDDVCFTNLDVEIREVVREYLGFYSSARRAAAATGRAPAMLGIELLGQLERRPFEWPKTGTSARRTVGDRAAVLACSSRRQPEEVPRPVVRLAIKAGPTQSPSEE